MAKTLNKFKVVDKHTGCTVRPYRAEHHARWAAAKLCEEHKSPGRYIVKAIG